MEQEWGRTNIPEIEKSRMALGTAWVHLRPPDPPRFGVLSFLVMNPRAVSEATTKGVDARESDDACRFLRNFSA